MKKHSIILSLLFIILFAINLNATVTVETSRLQYTCNGTTTTYAYTFEILEDDDLLAIATTSAGVESTLVLNTDYTVSGAGVSTGGNLVLTAGSKCPSGSTLTLLRNIELTQETDYVDGEAFSAESLEGAIDKTMLIQQQQQEILNRTIQVEKSSTLTGLTVIPSPGKAIGFNAAGDGITTYETSIIGNSSLPNITDYGSTLSSAITAIGSTETSVIIDSAINIGGNVTVPTNVNLIILKGGSITTTGYTLTINGSLSAGPYQIFTGSGTVSGLKEINAKWFGATGDGTTDDTDALQAAFTAWSSYSTLSIPAGTYKTTTVITRSELVGANLIFEGGAVIAPSGCGGIKLSGMSYMRVSDAWITRAERDWTTDDSGLEIDECGSSDITVKYIGNFQKGLHLSADDDGITKSKFYIGKLSNNKYGLYLGITGTGYINANEFFGGSIGLTSAVKTAETDAWGIYMSDASSRAFAGDKFYGQTLESLHNGMYVAGSGLLFSSQYFELIDNNWIEGATVQRSVFIAGTWYDSAGSITGYDYSKISLGNGSRNNVWLGKDNDTEMSILTESQYGGIGFIDIYGRNVIHQLLSYRSINSLIFTDAASVNQYFNKQYFSDDAAKPASGSYREGSVVWNNDPDAGEKIGIICDSSGTMGTLAGVTFSGTSGDAFGTVNDTTGLHTGAFISIAGVTGTKTILGIKGTTIYLSAAINATVTDAAVAYVNATWLDIAAQIGYRSGSGDPTGSVTPKFIGEEYYRTTGHWYKAHGLTNSDWTALN